MTAPPHPDVTVRRTRAATLLGASAVLLLVLSIVNVGTPWTFVAAVLVGLAMGVVDGSLLRWWRREPRRR